MSADRLAYRARPRRSLVVRRLLSGVALGGLAATLVGSIGCRGDDKYWDCDYQAEQFDVALNDRNPLLEPIPYGEPYPVAIKFSEEGLNKLLQGVVGQDVPFTGSLPFVWYTGPATLEFQATTDPVIELESLEGCPTCVQYSFEFNTQMYGPDGSPQGAGFGRVKFRIPIELEERGDSATALIADYTRLRVQDLYLNAFGLETEEHPSLVAALGIFMQDKIQADPSYGRTELLTLDSWEIGNNDVRLLVRKLLVFPEQDTLALAMQSNLPLPVGGGLEITGEMPMGVPMVVDFDIAMFESMIRRLMEEGEIPQIYNEDGEPDPDGNYGITLDSIQGGAEGQELMTCQFKVWRFAEGYCGHVLATMDLEVDLDEGSGVTISAGEAAILSGQGSGSVLEQEEDFVEENQSLIDGFRDDVASNLGTTINYDALAIEGSNIVFETLAKDVLVDHLETWIDFFVVEAPEGSP